MLTYVSDCFCWQPPSSQKSTDEGNPFKYDETDFPFKNPCQTDEDKSIALSSWQRFCHLVWSVFLIIQNILLMLNRRLSKQANHSSVNYAALTPQSNSKF